MAAPKPAVLLLLWKCNNEADTLLAIRPVLQRYVAAQPTWYRLDRSKANARIVAVLTGQRFKKLFTLFDNSGRVVRSSQFRESELVIHRDDLLSGLYRFTVSDEAGERLSSGSVVVH